MVKQDRRGHPEYGTPPVADEPVICSDLAVVGAGAAGLYAALSRRGRRRRASRSSRRPRSRRRRATGRRAGSPPRSRSRTPSPATSPTPRPPVATSCAARRRRCSSTRRPARVRDLEALGVRFDADRRGVLALGLEGGHSVRRVVHAGGSATGRRVVRQLSALVVDEPHITVLEGARATRRLDARRPLRRRRARGRPRGPRARDDPRHRRRRRAVVAHDEPAGLAGHRDVDRPRRRRRPRRSRVPAVSPHRRDRDPRPRGLPRHRGDPRRGRDAARARRRALRRGARAARRGLARDRRRCWRDTGATSVGLDMRAVDPALFPNVVSALQDAGLDPTREPIPVSPASHYMMGGVVTDLHGRSTVRRPVRRRRDRLHRPARRQPPGLQLAQRVLRLRRARRRAPGSTSPQRAPTAGAPPPAAPLVRPGRATQEALWRDAGIVRTRDGLRAPARGPASARPADRRLRAARARRAAARTSAPTSPRSTRRSTTGTRRSASDERAAVRHAGA